MHVSCLNCSKVYSTILSKQHILDYVEDIAIVNFNALGPAIGPR